LSFETENFACFEVGNELIYVIYLLTAIGLSPGGSTHLHTNSA